MSVYIVTNADNQIKLFRSFEKAHSYLLNKGFTPSSNHDNIVGIFRSYSKVEENFIRKYCWIEEYYLTMD